LKELNAHLGRKIGGLIGYEWTAVGSEIVKGK
jgi:hypothetical protein